MAGFCSVVSKSGCQNVQEKYHVLVLNCLFICFLPVSALAVKVHPTPEPLFLLLPPPPSLMLISNFVSFGLCLFLLINYVQN